MDQDSSTAFEPKKFEESPVVSNRATIFGHCYLMGI